MAAVVLIFFKNYYISVLKHISSGLHLDYRNLKCTELSVHTICINQINYNIQFTWYFLYINIVGKTSQNEMSKRN